MSWTAPRTFVTGEVETAAIFNTHLRDNLNALVPQSATISTSESTSSTAYTDLTTAGPSVTVVTGTQVLITLHALVNNATGAGNFAYMSVAISGATTLAAADVRAAGLVQVAASGDWREVSRTFLIGGLTAGSNAFKAQYRNFSAAALSYSNRDITVIASY